MASRMFADNSDFYVGYLEEVSKSIKRQTGLSFEDITQYLNRFCSDMEIPEFDPTNIYMAADNSIPVEEAVCSMVKSIGLTTVDFLIDNSSEDDRLVSAIKAINESYLRSGQIKYSGYNVSEMGYDQSSCRQKGLAMSF